ncbi:hypothetical protein SH611_22570 [Geminicoccaceae bacterium 1502E]|nr:hypothetical protein [Geminicoccaceae bacterium 1502E]
MISLRQHASLVLIDDQQGVRAVPPIPLQPGGGGAIYDEAWLRDLIFACPESLPLQEVDPSFGPLVPVCRELDTRCAGIADALFINPLGMPTLVECKLWRNTEARRKVVAQILDYARALRRWTFTDLQREAARARREQGFDLFAHVAGQGAGDLEQAAFVDCVTPNLGSGRMLLLVVGDGIREGVEAITGDIRGAAGLHFTFGLVEAQIYQLGEGMRLLQPRVLARTRIVERVVVDVSRVSGVEVLDDREEDPPTPRATWMKKFWEDLVATIRFDDRDQPLANPTAQRAIFFHLVRGAELWLNCHYRSRKAIAEVSLGYTQTNQLAVEIAEALEADREAISGEIGIPVWWTRTEDGKVQMSVRQPISHPESDEHREQQLVWFATTLNAVVNSLRPRIVAWLRDNHGQSGPAG